jgi:ATP-dependent protease ClpP protease subunit
VSADRVYRDGNRFYIGGEFNDAMEIGVVPPLRAEIDNQAGKRDGSIDLHIASVGGSAWVLTQIVELVELAKRKGVKVRTIVPSHAYSCGSMLAVTGTKGERYISRYAEHLLHYGSFDRYIKTTPLQIERNADKNRRWVKTIIDHYRRYADVPELEDKMRDDDLWVPAEQAIEWGLADKLTDELS